MQLARVVGDVVTMRKNNRGIRKAVLVQPLNLDSTNRGEAVLALDGINASVGDCVLLVNVAGRPESPLDLAVIGKVDRVELFPGTAGAKDK